MERVKVVLIYTVCQGALCTLAPELKCIKSITLCEYNFVNSVRFGIKTYFHVLERRIEDDINSCNGCILIADKPCFHQLLQSMIGRSRRVVTVAERIVDNSDDAMFRNGLMVFVQQLKKGINPFPHNDTF